MANPTIVDQKATTNSTGALTLPTYTVGDLLIAVTGSPLAITTVPTGWTQVGIASYGTTTKLSVLAKISTGSDSLNISSFSGSKGVGGFITSILASSWSGSITDLVFASGGATLNPPSVSVVTSLDILVLTGAFNFTNAITGAPTNYTNLLTCTYSSTTTTDNAQKMAIARRSLTATSEDPGAFTATSNSPGSWTLAIKPTLSVNYAATATLSGAGSFGAAGTLAQAGAATLAGAASVGAAASLTRAAGSTLSGSGSVAATGSRAGVSSATLAGSTTVAAAATIDGIYEDASTPPVVFGTGVGNITTAPFTPPAGTLMVAMFSGEKGAITGANLFDSAGGVWTLNTYTIGATANGGLTAIFTQYVTATPATPITVTASFIGLTGGRYLTVRVLKNALSPPLTGTALSFSSTSAGAGRGGVNLLNADIRSVVYGITDDPDSSTSLTAWSGTTLLSQQNNTTDGTTAAAWYSAPTSAVSAVNYGPIQANADNTNVSAIEVQSAYAYTTQGLTNGGVTAHFNWSYDQQLAATGVEPARTNAAIAACEADYAQLVTWFGAALASNITVRVGPGSGGATWVGDGSASTIVMSPGGASYSSSSDYLRYLLMAELSEIFMKTQNIGWFNNTTGNEGNFGEGLSRFLATQLILINGLTVGGNQAALLSNFATSALWLNSVRTDYLSAPIATNTGTSAATGACDLFLWYLNKQLGFSIPAIIAAGSTTLAGVYNTLTGTTFNFTTYNNFLKTVYPTSSGNVIAGPNPDNPFPWGSATLSAVGSLGPSATYTGVSAASISASATVTAAGTYTAVATATLAGAGSVSAVGSRTAVIAATLAAVGSLGAAAVRTTAGSATLAGTGSCSATGTYVGVTAATLAGSASLSATATYVGAATAAVAGVGSLFATAGRTAVGAAAIAGAGSVSSTATAGFSTSAALAGAGALSATGAYVGVTAAALAGVGSLSATAGRAAVGAATLPALGTLAATGARIGVATASLSVIGAMGASATYVGVATAALAGTAMVAAAGVYVGASSASLAGSGALSAAAVYTGVATAVLGGSGSLTAVTAGNLAGTAAISAFASVVAAAVYQAVTTAALVGVGGLAADAVRVAVSVATLPAAGSLTADAPREQAANAAIAASGVVGAVGVYTGVGATNIPGVGALGASGIIEASLGALLAGVGALTGDATATSSSAAAFAGSGSFTVAGTYIGAATATIHALAALAASGTRTVHGGASFVGQAVLAAHALRAADALATVAGHGRIFADADGAAQGLATLGAEAFFFIQAIVHHRPWRAGNPTFGRSRLGGAPVVRSGPRSTTPLVAGSPRAGGPTIVVGSRAGTPPQTAGVHAGPPHS